MQIAYGVVWDGRRRVLAGGMSTEEARRRDGAGEPYSALIVANGRPFAVVDRHDWYLAVWLFDERGRRAAEFDFRQVDPQRFMVHKVRRWTYRNEDPEFGEKAERHELRVDRPSSSVLSEVHHRDGSSTHSFYAIDVDRVWRPLPEFGDWSTLPSIPIEFIRTDLLAPGGQQPTRQEDYLHLLSDAETDDPTDAPLLATLVDSVPVSDVRHAPVPLPPADFDRWFADRATVSFPDGVGGRLAVVAAGMLRMPTGRFMATEPGWSTDRFEAFTVTVPPGSYPVELSITDLTNGLRLCANAMRMTIRDETVASWELALRDGQSPRELDDGEAYGFGVDGGMASLLDEVAFPVIQALDDESAYDWVNDPGYANLAMPGLDANVIATTTAEGDGTYPTWIGRTAAGDVACVIVDLEGLRDAVAIARDGDQEKMTRTSRAQ